MPKVDREGTFRGRVMEHGVTVTQKNSYPQWVARLMCEQMYVAADREAWEGSGYTVSEDGWVDVSDNNWSITGYFVLFNNEKALLNYAQVMAATGWDGAKFTALTGTDLTEHSVQFRIAENEYNGEVKLQAEWIDAVGAPVERELQSLAADDLKGLDAKFKGMMSTTKKAAPAPAKAPAPAAPAAKAPPAAAAAPAKAKGGPPAKKTPAPAPAEDAGVVPMTKDAAWDKLETESGLDEDDLATAWIAMCAEVADDKDEDEITEEEWGLVAANILAATAA